MYHIILVGAHGMLGNALKSVFVDQKLHCVERSQLDISDAKEVSLFFNTIRPDVIINAAGYTAVDACEDDVSKGFRINSLAVEYLSREATRIGATLIHYSTDYVFNGSSERGYAEHDFPNPINAYGRTKFVGEWALQRYCKKYYLLRTSWLFGSHGRNFVDTIRAKAAIQTSISVVSDQWGVPNYTNDLAQATHSILSQRLPFGIYHPINSGMCSWSKFAEKIIEYSGLSTVVVPIRTADYPLRAHRPQYSVLRNTKLPLGRYWEEALREYIEEDSVTCS